MYVVAKVKRKKPKSNSQLVLVPIKIHPREIRLIRAQAKKYADGNFSAWLRHAGLRYRPKRGETVGAPETPRLKKKVLTRTRRSVRR